MSHITLQRGTVPVLLHIPHSSVYIPAECRKDFSLDDKALAYEANWMGDLHTAQLYTTRDNPFWIVQSDLSRIVVDMERFEDDSLEGMSEFGMGSVYTHTNDGSEMRTLTPERKEWYLSTFFRPYHTAFEDAVKQCVDAFGSCLILDCHSFPSQPRYYEDQTPNRPDICLGTVEGYTPSELTAQLRAHFEENGLSVKENTPFAGSILPINLLEEAKYKEKISTLMIETNRKLYMDEHKFNQSADSDTTKRLVDQALEIARVYQTS